MESGCTTVDLDACTCFQPWDGVTPKPPCPVHNYHYVTPPPYPQYWPWTSDLPPGVSITTDTTEASAEPPDERDAFWHNVVAHPLLVLWPRLGRWLHDRTEPTAPRKR